MSESFILCIAKNGLTDCLSQIWHCTLYAKTHNRSIILTLTHYKGTSLFDLFDFSDYPVPVYDFSKISDVIYTDVEPAECKRMLAHGNDEIFRTNRRLNVPLDITEKYGDDVLIVHYDSGRGIDRVSPTIEFFKQIRFRPDFREFMKGGLSRMPTGYNAAQIRHTDHRTNLPKLLEVLDGFISSTTESLYLATDNSELIRSLKERYGDRILFNQTVCDRRGEAILQNQSDRGILENAFLDLFILARAANDITYFYKASESPYFGYTRLAVRLKTCRELIDRLLSI